MKWAKEQVDAFNVILARQLSSTEKNGQVWTECMEQARDHAKMLSEVALDFSSLIGSNTIDVPNGTIGLGLA